MIPYRASDADPKLLPDGDYLATLDRVKERVSSNDEPQYEIWWRIALDEKTHVIRDFFTMVRGKSWRLKKVAIALDALDVWQQDKFDPVAFLDRAIILTLCVGKTTVEYPDPKNFVKAYKTVQAPNGAASAKPTTESKPAPGNGRKIGDEDEPRDGSNRGEIPF
jgi:hypothetical protein